MENKLTNERVKAIEDTHNVYVDRNTMQYNVGGGHDAVYGWQPIPEEWMRKAEKNN
jgi:hypothetical protein